MPPSRYNLIHALAAAAVLLTAVFWQGFVPFWRQFVYGLAVANWNGNRVLVLSDDQGVKAYQIIWK